MHSYSVSFIFKKFVRPSLRWLGLDIVRYGTAEALPASYPEDFSESNIRIIEAVKHCTMTTPENVNALIDAVRYIVASGVEGAFVECGVWKGGSSMAVALALRDAGDENREIFLYDTFAGMTEPTDIDQYRDGSRALPDFERQKISANSSSWCYSALDEVRRNMSSTGYPGERLHFVEGRVEDTIPGVVPRKIALLRLDTDWYESTKHELEHLYPFLAARGVLIVDDYGYWTGARKAFTEFAEARNLHLLLHRVDTSSRITVKIPA